MASGKSCNSDNQSRAVQRAAASTSAGAGIPRFAKRTFPSGPIAYTVRFTISPLQWYSAATFLAAGSAMIPGMEPLHISEGDLAKDVRSILQRVETGIEVIVERDAHPVAVIRPAEPAHRKISECIALMPADSTATIDPDFAKDVEAAVAAHREALEPPNWD